MHLVVSVKTLESSLSRNTMTWSLKGAGGEEKGREREQKKMIEVGKKDDRRGKKKRKKKVGIQSLLRTHSHGV